MIVVADTSPINYLVLIDHVSILPKLYGEIVIPPAVEAELLHPDAPAAVRHWMFHPPEWVEVRTPPNPPSSIHPKLQAGEWQAIALAEAGGAGTLLLIDEAIGRREASRLGLDTVGTLGVLRRAYIHGVIADIASAISALKSTNFKASEELFNQATASFDRAKKP